MILFSLSLHIDICSISDQYILLCFPRLCILTSTVFHFCISYSAFLVSSYWHLQDISSAYFTLLSISLNIGICIISVLYNLLCFRRRCILTTAMFQFCIFYFVFFVSPCWHPQYFNSVFYFAYFLSVYW